MKPIFVRCLGLITLFLSATALPASQPFDFSQAKWILDSESDGITVSRWTPPNSDLFAFRSSGLIDATVPKLVNILCDAKRRPEWAPALIVSYVVRWLSPTERVEYNRIRTPWPISDRDFVIQGKAEFDGKGAVALNFHSIDDPTVPDKGPVRGEAWDSTYALTPTADRKQSTLEYRMLIDPKGAVPSWVVNIFQSHFPHDMIIALRKQAAKADIGDYPMPAGSGWENRSAAALAAPSAVSAPSAATTAK